MKKLIGITLVGGLLATGFTGTALAADQIRTQTQDQLRIQDQMTGQQFNNSNAYRYRERNEYLNLEQNRQTGAAEYRNRMRYMDQERAEYRNRTQVGGFGLSAGAMGSGGRGAGSHR